MLKPDEKRTLLLHDAKRIANSWVVLKQAMDRFLADMLEYLNNDKEEK